MTTTVYNVPDVNCEHCVRAVTQEVGKLDGVEDVQVDLQERTVTVRRDEQVTDAQIIAALDEAGYDVAP